MSIKNKTPMHLRCVGGGCPAVYKIGDKLMIVGDGVRHMSRDEDGAKDVTLAYIDLYNEGKLSPLEDVVVIDEALLGGLVADGMIRVIDGIVNEIKSRGYVNFPADEDRIATLVAMKTVINKMRSA